MTQQLACTVLAEITWRPEVGDRNPWSWCITVTYFAACWLCLSAGRRESLASRNGGSRLWRLWFVFAGMMLLLGINKQLDLQTLLTQVGREIARHDGWYQHRRLVQAIFVAACGVLGLVSSVAGLFLLRKQWQQFGVAFIGIVSLTAFIVMRAASLNHLDTVRFVLPQAGNGVYFGLELGGTLLVALGSLLATGTTSSHDAPRRGRTS